MALHSSMEQALFLSFCNVMLIGLYLICSLEKINGDLYDFSTNKKVLKQPVDVWLPCHPITHPNLQEIKLKALFKGEEDWVYHNWTLFVS